MRRANNVAASGELDQVAEAHAEHKPASSASLQRRLLVVREKIRLSQLDRVQPKEGGLARVQTLDVVKVHQALLHQALDLEQPLEVVDCAVHRGLDI